MFRVPVKLILFALIVMTAAALVIFPNPAAAQSACGNAPQPRLTAGQMGRVTISNGVGNNLRASTDTNATVLGVMPDGEIFSVLAGPNCVSDLNWWQVRRWDGQTGWTAEGSGLDYWLEPWPVTGAALAPGNKPTADLGTIVYLSDSAANTRRVILMAPDGTQIADLVPQTVVYAGWPVWSPDGKVLAFVSGPDADHTDISIVGRERTFATLTTLGGKLMRPSWSPDGTKITFAAAVGGSDQYDIYVINADGSGLANLTNSTGTSETYPAWSPDGQQIAFTSTAEGVEDIYVMDAATGLGQQLTTDPAAEWFPVWSPDGKQIAYYREIDGQADLFIVDEAGALPVMLAEDVHVPVEDVESGPVFSPDGKRIAYIGKTTPDSDATDLFTVRPDGTDPLQYTADGSALSGVSWSPDGVWLVFGSYRSGNANIYAIKSNGTGFATLTNAPTNEEQPRWGKPVPPSGTPTATPAPGVTQVVTPGTPSAHPGTTDLLLFYDPNVPVFTLQNTSGGPVNIAPLSFSGAGVTVSTNIWNSEFLSSPLDQFVTNGCLQIWHFSLGTLQPPAECGTNRQGWVADETSIFWTQGSFTVSYNNAQIATCDVAAGRCVIDLP